jgi:excisionase family DNA binding protein
MHVLSYEDRTKGHPITDASKRIGVSTFTTRRKVKEGKIRVVRVGSRVLIPGEELDRILREGI